MRESMPKAQVERLEANPAERFGDPREAGRKGAQKREQNRLATLSSAREHVELVQVPIAIQAFDDLLVDNDPRARRYRYSVARDVLAGTGVLTEQKRMTVDIRVEISALIAAFEEPSRPALG